MIDKNTILSVYKEKQTLLEYLTAIEKALDKAVLVSADIVDEGSNKCCFVFTFEDDTKIITPTIEIIKPVKGATIRNGVLYLTLADGTEVSAGSITASFGDAEVDGNLKVNGTIEQGTYELDEDISISNLPAGLNCNYAHARAANGKLNIVISIWQNANTTPTFSEVTGIGHINLPSDVLSKLYPYVGGFLDFRCLTCGTYSAITNDMSLVVSKGTNGLDFAIKTFTGISVGVSQSWRFEFNFILR